MPLWALILLGVGGALLLGAAAVGGVFAWRHAERRYVLRLVGLLAASESARVALCDAFARLAESSEAQIEAFADDPDSVERHVLSEVAVRASILVEELDTLRVPPRLRDAADAVADAAYTVARESGRVREEQTGDEVLDSLAEIDLETVTVYATRAREAMKAICDTCGLEDPAVYGGGMYL